jgi:transposase InsO family protein
MSGKKVPASTKEAIAATLTRQLGACDGHLPNLVLRQLAEAHDVSVDTVKRVRKRVLRGEPPGAARESSAVTLDRDDLAAIGECHGNVRAAWRRRRTEGYAYGYETFLAAFNRLDPLMKIGLREGAHAAAARGPKVLQVVEHRNDLWHWDHTEADHDLWYRNAVIRAWLTVIVDACTRFLLMLLITVGDGVGGDPNTDGIVATLCEAMAGDVQEDGRRYGGIPVTVAYDNASTHVAAAVLNGCGMLGTVAKPIRKASPWEQGNVEGLVGTVTDEFLNGLPGFTHGPDDRWGKPGARVGKLLHLHHFEALAENFVNDYNFRRPHSSLGGLTPAEAWNSQSNAIDYIDLAEARHLFLGDPTPRTVWPYGVEFSGVKFTSLTLVKNHLGEQLAIRHLPNNRRFVSCYTLDGELIDDAVPHAAIDPGTLAEMRRYTESVGQRVMTAQKEGRRRAEEHAIAKLVEMGFSDAELVDPENPEPDLPLVGPLADQGEADRESFLDRFSDAVDRPTNEEQP